MATRIEVLLLAKWCYFLAVSGGDIVRNVVRSGRLDVADKSTQEGEFDPTTLADRKTQAFIVGNLRGRFPDIVVIGEEDEEDDSDAIVCEQPAELPSDIDNDPYFQCSEWAADMTEAMADDIRIFVDPVDGTNDLTKGVHDAVTVLVGFAIAGHPVYGVVHYPFSERTVHACVGHSRHKIFRAVPKRPEENVAVSSSSHFNDALKAYFRDLQPQPKQVIRVGGCGHKAILVLDGKADAYLYPRSGTKKWDTCAPHAIIRAHHGHMVDKHGRELMYDCSTPIMNEDGVICTLAADPSLYTLKESTNV